MDVWPWTLGRLDVKPYGYIPLPYHKETWEIEVEVPGVGD